MPRQNTRLLIAICASLLAISALALATTNSSAAQGPCRGNWAEGVTYNVGDSVRYNGATYTALQTHTAHVGAGWTPASTPSLWRTGGSCAAGPTPTPRSEEHTSELQSLTNLVCRLLLEKKKEKQQHLHIHDQL